LLRDRAIWRFGLVAMLFVQLDEAYLAFVIAYLRRDQHLTPARATLTASALVVGTIVGFTIAARRARRGSTRAALQRAAGLLAVSSLGIALLSGPVPVALCGLVFGIAGARFWVVFHAAVLRHRPGRAGSVTAVVGNLEMLGFGFPIAIGAIADAHGLRAGLVGYAVIPVALLVVAGSVTDRATV
jgi:MFS family permease